MAAEKYTPADRARQRVARRLLEVANAFQRRHRHGNGYAAQCPVCGSLNLYIRVDAAQDRVVVACADGCPEDLVLADAGLSLLNLRLADGDGPTLLPVEAVPPEALGGTGTPFGTPAAIHTATELMAAAFAPLVEVVQGGLLYEGLTILAGRPKLGKSWLALALSLAVACGGRALGRYEVTPGSVLYLDLEGGERRLQRRLSRLLGEAPPPVNWHYATQWPRVDGGGVEQLRDWLKSAEGPRLVVIDTLARFRPAPTGRGAGSVYREDYDSLAPLTDLIQQHAGLGLLCVHHTRKLEADDPLDAVSGSYGLTGAVDGVLILRRSKQEATVTLTRIHRDADGDLDVALRYDGVTSQFVALDGPVGLHTGTAERVAVLDALRREGAPLGAEGIARASFTDGDPGDQPERYARHYEAVRKMVTRLAEGGVLTRVGRGRYTLADTPHQMSQCPNVPITLYTTPPDPQNGQTCTADAHEWPDTADYGNSEDMYTGEEFGTSDWDTCPNVPNSASWNDEADDEEVVL